MGDPAPPETPPAGTADGLLEMVVAAVVVDPDSKTPVLLLRGVHEPRLFLPIYVGAAEAASIAMALAGVPRQRPGTHDLFVSTLRALDWGVERALVTRVDDGTFYAELALSRATGERLTLDARPSDAVALAVREGAPLLVRAAVLEAAGGVTPDAEPAQWPDAGRDAAPEVASHGGKEPPTARATRRAREEGDAATLADPWELDPTLFSKYKM